MGTNKSIGTAFESAIVKYFISCGFTSARRIPLAGRNDCGDIHIGEPNNPYFVIEAKSRKIETPYKMVEDFIEEVYTEYRNAKNVSVISRTNALVIVKRPNLGVADSWVIWKNCYNITVRCRLGDIINAENFLGCNSEHEMCVRLENIILNV